MTDWKKELARDTIALGGIPFFFMILVRLMIGEGLRPFYTTLYHFAAVAFVFLLFSFYIRHPNYYVSRSIALLVFASLHYQDLYFTLFASFLFICLIASLLYSGKKKLDLFSGAVIGSVSSAVAYFSVKYAVVAFNLPL